ncbi:MAG: PfaD family polyunsaturated fatty acid/polyketide biosynthesis protein [Planctomycetota bacterium]|nr:PfaD family polyunsaturated fatty acid/polyketide biosynthesis protein [Planctomycetota bacterium]
MTATGWWKGHGAQPIADGTAQREAFGRILEPLFLVRHGTVRALARGGEVGLHGAAPEGALPLTGFVPSVMLEHLGSADFCRDHGLRYAYVTGAMANGIASAEIVEAMGQAGMLGFFGAAGLPPAQVEAAVERVQRTLGSKPYGFNLIHSPAEPDLEAAIVDLYLRKNVRLVEASAFLDLTLPAVRYRVHGIHRGPDGKVATPNRIVAKVSRVEVAAKFFAPPPEKFLRELVAKGELTEEQALLAQEIPMAQDLTAEADSGGHTDNRPAISLIPTMLALRDQQQAKHGFAQRLRVGAAGGVSTPASAAAALAMGADYLVTGSVNQACVESGTSAPVKAMLAQAQQADTAMAAAADMFEMGVKVQVLKRGTMFAMRASKLYELYRACESLEAIPAAERAQLEKSVFRKSIEEVWADTRAFFEQRDPAQNAKAERDPKHKMALVFRWYLGQSSRWAKSGDASRQMDFQVWCGPAMGAFNEWTKGTFLEKPEERRVVTVGLNLLYGAAVLARVNAARAQGVAVASEAARVEPLPVEKIQDLLGHAQAPQGT